MNISELISRLQTYTRLDDIMDVKVVVHNETNNKDRETRYCDIDNNSINTVKLCPNGHRIEINVHTDFGKE